MFLFLATLSQSHSETCLTKQVYYLKKPEFQRKQISQINIRRKMIHAGPLDSIVF